MRDPATYRGARRNRARAIGKLAEWRMLSTGRVKGRVYQPPVSENKRDRTRDKLRAAP